MSEIEQGVIRTPLGEIWFADGVVNLRITCKRVTAEVVRGHFDILIPVAEDAGALSLPVLIDLGLLEEMDIEARHMVVEMMDPRWNERVAAVYHDPVQRVIASFFLGLDRAKIPVQVTGSRAEALAWLRHAAGSPAPPVKKYARAEAGDLEHAVDVLSRLASSDFGAPPPSPGGRTERDALAAGLAMMAEELKHSAERLRRSEEKYRRLFECSGEAVLVYDLDGTITDVNPRAELLAGYSAEELVGANIFALGLLLADEEAAARDVMARVLSGEVVDRVRFTFCRKDGTERLSEITVAPLTDADGNTVGVINVGMDVT